MVWRSGQRTPPRRLSIVVKVVIGCAILAALAVLGTYGYYRVSLRPVSATDRAVETTIPAGATMSQIAQLLDDAGVIRHAWAFEWYVHLSKSERYLMAGSYVLSPSQSTPDIATMLTHGKVSSKLVLVLPGQRLDQIRQSLINQGFQAEAVEAALEPAQYENLAVLAGKPAGASLEGYLYPESFEKNASTSAADIVKQALQQMTKQLTAERTAAFERQGLSVYQAITLASIVEKEASRAADQSQIAQVFLARLRSGMTLGSDVTVFYGSQLAGLGNDITFDSPYNTRLHVGLPPTPISNVTASSLDAVANPATTDWLYFVAGDDGVVHFSKTLAEHEALTEKYCKKLCE